MCFYRNLKAFESLKAIKPMVPRWMSPFRSPFREETGGYSHMQVVSCWEHVKRPFVPILSAFLLLGYPILRLKSCQISNVSCYVMLKNPKSSASPALPQPFPPVARVPMNASCCAQRLGSWGAFSVTEHGAGDWKRSPGERPTSQHRRPTGGWDVITFGFTDFLGFVWGI